MEISTNYLIVDAIAVAFGLSLMVYAIIFTKRRRRRDNYLKLCLYSPTANLFFERLQSIGMLGREGQLRLEKAFHMVRKHRLDCGLLAQVIGRYLREMDIVFRSGGSDHRGYVWVAEEIATYYSPQQSNYLPFVLSIPEYDPDDTTRKAELTCEIELYLSPKRWAARKEAEKRRLEEKRASSVKEEKEGIQAFQPLSQVLFSKRPEEVSTSLPPWIENETQEDRLPSVV